MRTPSRDRPQRSSTTNPTQHAYVSALRMLARRELSERQIRQRLERRQHDADAIDAAVTRLKEERAIDDERVAGAIAHAETAFKRRGRLRVRQQIERAGVSTATAKAAVERIFGDLDEDALLAGALAKRLKPGHKIEGRAEFARLCRYLLGQGFDMDRIMRALSARRGSDRD